MGRGGAVCALDRGWGAAVAAVDGEPKPRRRSGEVWWLEQGKVSEMSVCKCKSECARSSRMCSGYRRRCGCVGAGAGTPAGGVAARAAAARRGESRSGPARGREGGGKAEEDAWHGSERRGGGGGAAHCRQERRRRVGQRNRGGRGWRRKMRTSL
jgi:hypothetical protein